MLGQGRGLGGANLGRNRVCVGRRLISNDLTETGKRVGKKNGPRPGGDGRGDGVAPNRKQSEALFKGRPGAVTGDFYGTYHFVRPPLYYRFLRRTGTESKHNNFGTVSGTDLKSFLTRPKTRTLLGINANERRRPLMCFIYVSVPGIKL